jgi:hypothetical protein
LQLGPQNAGFFLGSKMFLVLLFCASLFAIVPALYLEFEWIRPSIQNLFFFSTGKLKASNLLSLVEVAIGVNLALSVIDAFSNYMQSLFSKRINELDPNKNPTFAEAIRDVVNDVKDAFNGPESTEDPTEKLQSRFAKHITEQRKLFESNAADFMIWIKALGFVTSGMLFWVLINICLDADFELLRAIAHCLWLASVMPILIHLSGLTFMYAKYDREVQRFEVNGNREGFFQHFVKQTMKKYREKKRHLSDPDKFVQTKDDTASKSSVNTGA